VTQLSHRVPGKPHSRSLWRRLRRLLATAESIDLDEIGELIAKFEASQRNIQETQHVIADVLRAHAPAPFTPPLISASELATGNRYELENRCRALTNPVYLGNDTALCRVLGSYKMYLDTNDTGFGSHVLLDGYWEAWLTVFFARQVRPGMRVVDVGANFGYYTLLFGALVGPAGHVFAVEPNPVVLPKLRRSVELNGLAGRTTIIAAAAGAEDGEATLFVPHGEPKNSTIVATADGIAREAGTIHKVPRIKLDQVAAAARIDLIKIDAEGAEQDILAGMESILRRDKPCLLLEFNAGRYADPAGFVDWLGGLYGRMRHIDFEANAAELTVEQLLGDRSGQDWLLLFDEPQPAAPA
jgi:FkbM family methyltransferase